ncbi:MAG: N-acetylmuramoyl-L-alanine amidase [Actinobacteria bacterium]|nr:N-acetylmuramoyl-L-alanine amidase [Actinomycetota bacterium]
MRTLRLTLLLALAFPAAALAEEATIVSRSVPLGGERMLAVSEPPDRFNLVGLHWRGPGSVHFRTRSLAGRWSVWKEAAPEEEDQPDAATGERARTASWRLGNPWWVGPSDRIEYRLRGSVTKLRAFFVWSPTSGAPGRTLQKAGAPRIVPRRGWSADEKIRRGNPSVAPALRLALVHHTAGGNGYTAAESPAIVKAIQLYHVKGNGWNDIGYNFLVDRFGQVFEGRYGGLERNVVGAHAEGFNTGSVGVAVLGEYGSLAVTQKARDALATLLAWRLDVAHVDPATTLSFISGGNARFPAGLPVFLRTVSGHRDTGFTDCPGRALYSLLTALAGDVSRRGLPKLYSPLVTGAVPGMVRFKARLSSALPWTVEVYDAAGSPVGSSGGLGPKVAWNWDASLLPPGNYSYAISSEENVTPALGTLASGEAALSLAGLAADPETVSPNEDDFADETTITYTLTSAANVTMKVRDDLGGEVATIAAKTWKRAGEHALRFDPSVLPDGIFQIELEARGTGGRQANAATQLVVSRTLGGVRAARLAFSPNADGRADRIAFRFELTASAQVRLRILKQGTWVATAFKGPLDEGVRQVEWDGAKRVGRLLDGTYDAVIEATDAVTTARVTVPFAADTRQPRIRIVQRFPLKLWVSEPARVTLRFGKRRLVHEAQLAGETPVPNAPRLGIVRAVAWDPAGNTSIPASKR